VAAKRGKSQARRNSGNGNGIPGWVWGAFGLVLGVVLILVVPRYFKRDGDGFFRPHPNPDAQPAPVAEEPDAVEAGEAPIEAGGTTTATAPAKKPTNYDFYTMLPGKEVPLSDAELAATANAEAQRAAQKPATAPATATATATDGSVASTTSATPPAPAALPAPVDTAATPAAAAQAPATTSSAASTPVASAPAKAPAPDAAAPAKETRYLLQAGAFEASGQAEELKAKIAMLGLGARVEAAKIGARTVYRVRMGPYGTATDLAEAKRKLAAGGQSAMAIKVQ